MTQTFTNNLGIRLRKMRRDRNMTQERLAELAGLNRSFISDVERGRKGISIANLHVLAQVYKMPVSELLEGL